MAGCSPDSIWARIDRRARRCPRPPGRPSGSSRGPRSRRRRAPRPRSRAPPRCRRAPSHAGASIPAAVRAVTRRAGSRSGRPRCEGGRLTAVQRRQRRADHRDRARRGDSRRPRRPARTGPASEAAAASARQRGDLRHAAAPRARRQGPALGCRRALGRGVTRAAVPGAAHRTRARRLVACARISGGGGRPARRMPSILIAPRTGVRRRAGRFKLRDRRRRTSTTSHTCASCSPDRLGGRGRRAVEP